MSRDIDKSEWIPHAPGIVHHVNPDHINEALWTIEDDLAQAAIRERQFLYERIRKSDEWLEAHLFTNEGFYDVLDQKGFAVLYHELTFSLGAERPDHNKLQLANRILAVAAVYKTRTTQDLDVAILHEHTKSVPGMDARSLLRNALTSKDRRAIIVGFPYS